MRVSQLVGKMKEESMLGAESNTMIQLLDMIASLSQSQFGLAMDAISMIWNCLTGPLNLPKLEPKSTPPVGFTLSPNWHRHQQIEESPASRCTWSSAL